jgi:succinate dehydrogenase/fumarate reductase flavoprotein subunit
MGGVAIDVHCATRVPGLYACGEVAGGVHGANRLTGNATSQILVQGSAAGVAAAAFAKRTKQMDIPPAAWNAASENLSGPLARTSGVLPHEIKEELQRFANLKVGMLRNHDSLKEALEGARRLRRDALPRVYCRAKDRVYNKEWADAVECRSMLDTLEATALCALRRQESRGAHYREDFPAQDNAAAPWNGIITMSGDEIGHGVRATNTHRLAPPREARAIPKSA